jgi:hypothetical protein
MDFKVCKQCGKRLSISEFKLNKYTKDGYSDFCRDCVDIEKCRRKADRNVGNQK